MSRSSAVNPTWVAFFREVKRLADIERGRELSRATNTEKNENKNI